MILYLFNRIRMRHLLFFLSVYCLALSLPAQNRFIDSIQTNLRNIQADTQRVGALGDLCFYYRYVNIDSAIYYGNKSYELATAIKFLRGQAAALNNLGLAYREYGDLSKSLELQFKALKICIDHNYIAERGLCYRRIGLVYMDLNNFELARDYHLKAVHDHELIKSKRYLSIEFQNLSRIYLMNNNIDSSRFYINKALLWVDEAVDLKPDFYGVLMQLEQRAGRYREALTAYKEGVGYAQEFSDFRNLCHLNLYAANVYTDLKRTDSALICAEKSVAFGQRINFKLGLFRAYDFLARYYDKINAEKALYYLKLANSAKESLFGAGNIQVLQNLVSKENQRQVELDNAQKAYRDRLKMYGLGIGIAFLSILIFFLYKNSRRQKKVNDLLQEQKAEIEKALTQLKSTQQQLVQSEKMASLGELTAGIAHEIQNPLNFVNNFSEVSNELIDEMNAELDKGDVEEAKAISADIKDNLTKINHHGKRADAIVKGMLQHSRSSSGQKELTDLNQLCDEYLRLAYHGYRAKDKSFNAAFETHFDPALPKVNVIPQEVGRVVLNLINNAFYAVNEKTKNPLSANPQSGYSPKVTVSTKREENTIEIIVADNGSGIPASALNKIFQPFFTTKPTGQGTGLGLSLSYDIITKGHGGELKVETKEGEGTTFIIELPANS